jgi:hypothetical protein
MFRETSTLVLHFLGHFIKGDGTANGYLKDSFATHKVQFLLDIFA